MTIFHIVHMVVIDTQCSLESFRRFIIESTCSSYIPESYASDYEIFAERDADLGSIYVEAADKQTLKKIRDVTFVNARSVLGVNNSSRMFPLFYKSRILLNLLQLVQNLQRVNVFSLDFFPHSSILHFCDGYGISYFDLHGVVRAVHD